MQVAKKLIPGSEAGGVSGVRRTVCVIVQRIKDASRIEARRGVSLNIALQRFIFHLRIVLSGAKNKRLNFA